MIKGFNRLLLRNELRTKEKRIVGREKGRKEKKRKEKKRNEMKRKEKKKMGRKGEKRTVGKILVMKLTGAFLSDISMTQLWVVIAEHKELVCISFLSFELVSSKWEVFIPALLIFIIMEMSRI